MKSLTQFLLEGRLQKGDYNKSDHKYVKMVIDDLLNNKPIRLGENGETIANIDQLELSKFIENWDGKIPETRDDFDLLMSRYPSFPKWNNIYKNKYSGHDTQSTGQQVEALVCSIFNNGEDVIDEWIKKNIPEGLPEYWINSCKWTVKFMNKQTGVSVDKWNNSNYIAYRVDRGDCGTDDSLVMDIVSLFRGTAEMNKKLKSKHINIISCNDLYSGSKDTWNKADIVLVHKSQSVDFFEKMKDASVINGETLNNYLIKKTIDGTIIPISLKQLSSPNAHLSEVNIKQKELPIDIIDGKQPIKLRVADNYQDETYVGTVDILCKNIDGEDVSITFRRTTGGDNTNNLSIEPKPTKGVYNFGKAVAVMKSLLGLNRGNKYYAKTKSNEEALNMLKKYFDNIQISHKSTYNKCKPAWHTRACVAGLLGMLNAYKSKITRGEDKNFTAQFANFCMLSAMGLNSKGAFYKIS